jgi:hemolysin III
MSCCYYPPQEELANRLTHGFGAVLSLAGLVLMVFYSSQHGDLWHVSATAIYGLTLVLLYSASTIYHTVRQRRWRLLCQKIDHAAIFLLIAGTYTPFMLSALRSGTGWNIFGVVWGCALAGVVVKFIVGGRGDVLSTFLYLALSWLILLAARPMFEALPQGALKLLLAGGACYTFGTVFYLWDKLPFNHAVWHVWVLAGSACHWLAIFGYIVPPIAKT